jgi:hypothetical protein
MCCATKDATAGADRFNERALAIAERALGPKPPQRRRSLQQIFANVLRDPRTLQAGRSRFTSGPMAIDEKALGPNHTERRPSLAATSAMCCATKDASSRRSRFTSRAPWPLIEKALGPNHPNIAADCGILANVLSNRGRYEQRNRSSSALWPSNEKPLVQTTQASPSPAAIWAMCYATKDTTSRRSLSTSAL